MSYLPIVERELRTAARRRSTHRVRFWTAVIGIAANFVFLLIATFSGGGAASVGTKMFQLLTWYAFGLCLLAGVFLTADCLSEERRDGTLGLLFLTDLRGYDIVLGKFMARSLNALYGLVAVLPIIGIPLIVGGVTGGEFWRAALALMNALFVSLSLGIWVSRHAKEATRAMGQTVALLLFLVAGLLGLGALVKLVPQAGSLGDFVARFSPFYPFTVGTDALYSGQAGRFWGALVLSNLVGWAALVWASIALGRSWQDRPASSGGLWSRWVKPSEEGVARRANRLRRWMAINPVFWLVGEEPGLRRTVWVLVSLWIIAVCCFILACFLGGVSSNMVFGAHALAYLGKPIGFILKMLLAVQACRFFSESRRNGALEMLLTTPLRSGEMIRGQWLALQRMFMWPFIVVLALWFVTPAAQMIATILQSGWQNALPGLGMMIGGTVYSIYFGVGFLADAIAVGWFGMWLALTSQKPNSAPGLTILLVLVVPSIGFCGLDLLADLFFILWGAIRLQQDFRWILNKG